MELSKAGIMDVQSDQVQENEEDLGVLGPPITGADLQRINNSLFAEEQARQDLYALMAANMIIKDRPRNTYFVREPGL